MHIVHTSISLKNQKITIYLKRQTPLCKVLCTPALGAILTSALLASVRQMVVTGHIAPAPIIMPYHHYAVLS